MSSRETEDAEIDASERIRRFNSCSLWHRGFTASSGLYPSSCVVLPAFAKCADIKTRLLPPPAFAVRAVSSAQSPDGRVCQGRINLESIRQQTSQRGVSANRRRGLPVTKTALAKASLVTQSLENVTQSPLNGFGLTLAAHNHTWLALKRGIVDLVF